jgi:hypothetical protein
VKVHVVSWKTSTFSRLFSASQQCFFSHNKSANSTFSRLFLAKRTGWFVSGGSVHIEISE